MKILIITGILAKNVILKNIKDYTKHELYLEVMPLPIAAFITPKVVIYYLKEKNVLKSVNTDKSSPVDNIDMIITPGLMRQDSNNIQEQLRIPSFKGPTNASDIRMTLDIIGDINLSTTKPADILIRDQQYKEAMKIINDYKSRSPKINQLLEKKSNILIKDCPVGLDFPMRVLGEISNAPSLTDEELFKTVNYYVESGADMIDIGMHVGENNPEHAYHMIKLVTDNFDIPVSIDTLNPKEIKAGLDAGCDLVLSLDHGNYDKVIKDIEDNDATAVILPTDYSRNYIPDTPIKKVESLGKLDNLCKNIRTISDTLLDPINSPSLTDSIVTMKLFREKYPEKLLFFGAGNVSELLDADSNGVNAVLSGLAMEVNANILFTPEASLKTKNSIKELKTASSMMFISKQKNTIPKNLGLNLIQLKDAYNKEDAPVDTSNLKYIKAVADGKFIPDRKGSFKIIVEDDVIKAILYQNYEATAVIYGTTARAMYEEILRRDLISRMEHASYLGMELEKAEIALKLNKKYIQDFPIF